MAQPLAWLETIEPDDGTDIDWVFAFRADEEPSEMASGHQVKSPVGVGNLLSDFLIGRRTHGEEDRSIIRMGNKDFTKKCPDATRYKNAQTGIFSAHVCPLALKNS